MDVTYLVRNKKDLISFLQKYPDLTVTARMEQCLDGYFPEPFGLYISLETRDTFLLYTRMEGTSLSPMPENFIEFVANVDIGKIYSL